MKSLIIVLILLGVNITFVSSQVYENCQIYGICEEAEAGDTYINGTSGGNITDTNETVRVDEIAQTHCAGDVLIGFYSNGTGICEDDDTGGGGGMSWTTDQNDQLNTTGNVSFNSINITGVGNGGVGEVYGDYLNFLVNVFDIQADDDSYFTVTKVGGWFTFESPNIWFGGEESTFDNNATVEGNLTVEGNYCNATNCYTIADFLLDTTGSGGGFTTDQNGELNRSGDPTFNSVNTTLIDSTGNTVIDGDEGVQLHYGGSPRVQANSNEVIIRRELEMTSNNNISGVGNIFSDFYCNDTNCYTVADFLLDTTGSGDANQTITYSKADDNITLSGGGGSFLFEDNDTTYTSGDGNLTLVGTEFGLDWSSIVTYLSGALDFFSGSWNDLTDIPSGFADNVDNDSQNLTYDASTDAIMIENGNTIQIEDNDTTYTHLSNFTNDINGSGKVNITYSWGENALLSSGTYEWSIGNGESGSYVDSKIMQDGKIVGMHLHCNTAGPTSVEVEAQIDGVSSGCSVTGSGTDEFDSCDVDLSSGEKITPYTITGGTHSNCIVSIIVQHDLGVGGEDAWKHQVLTFSEGRMWADLTVDYDNREVNVPYSGFYTRCSGRFRDFSFNFGPTTQLELTENGSWMFYTRVNNSNSGLSINQTSILGVLQGQPRYNYTTTDDLTFPKNSWITVYADRLATGIDWNHALFEVKVELNDNDCLYN